jgi:ornithine--oxo-acid transaminase
MTTHQTAQLTRTQQLVDMESDFAAHTYHPLDVVIERAQGVWVYDVEGNRYMDCLAAYSAVNQGHCHPRILEALLEQAGKITLTSRAFRNEQFPLFCQELTELTGFEMVLPMNSGAEAVETAIKTARKWGHTVKGIPQNQAEIIVCAGNFHGRTTTIVSFSSDEQYREGFGPFTPGFKIIPYGDIEALRAAITPNTCAFLVEPGGTDPGRSGHRDSAPGLHEAGRRAVPRASLPAHAGRDSVGPGPHRQAVCLYARRHRSGRADCGQGSGRRVLSGLCGSGFA